MIKPFDFYFDFISPYSFLAHKEIRKIELKASIKIRYKPILLGGLHNLHGIKAPAFIPAKAKHMIKDCKLIAERNNIKFKFKSYFPIRSLNLMRGVFVAEESKIDKKGNIFNNNPKYQNLTFKRYNFGKRQNNIAVQKNHPLYQIINGELLRMKEDGSLYEISKKWLSYRHNRALKY